MTADELEHAAIAVGGSAALVTLLVHEAEVLPAVRQVREARQQSPGRGLGLIEPAGMEEAKGGVGCVRQFVAEDVVGRVPDQAGGDHLAHLAQPLALFRLPHVTCRSGRSRRLALGRLVLRQAAHLVLLAIARKDIGRPIR
jgi:hypothetical protein